MMVPTSGKPRRSAARVIQVGERFQLWLLRQSWFERLLSVLPRNLRWLLRKVYFAPLDIADRFTDREHATVPPRRAMFTGANHDFVESGRLPIAALEHIAGLTPSSQMLDLGCGIGRIALAAASYLDASGRYEGLDIVPEGIKWCSQNIQSPHNNVRFTLADVYNGEYNPKGKIRASDYRLPFEDNSLDLAVLFSVFTHMLPADVDHYVSELARVLKPGGRLVASYCLINDVSRDLMRTHGNHRFTQNHGTHWTRGGKVHELAIAYGEVDALACLAKHGFDECPKTYYGGWCGRTVQWGDPGLKEMQQLNDYAGDGGQDTVVAIKL